MYAVTLILFVFIVVSHDWPKLTFKSNVCHLLFMLWLLYYANAFSVFTVQPILNLIQVKSSKLDWNLLILYCAHACTDKWTALWFQGSLMRGVAHSHISISLVQLSLFCDCRGGARQQTTSITAGNYDFIKSWWRIFWPLPYCKCFCILMRFKWSDIVIST